MIRDLSPGVRFAGPGAGPPGHGLLFLVLLGAVIVLILVVLWRGGSLGPDAFSRRSLLRAYLRVAFILSMFVVLLGAGWTLTAVFSQLLGRGFSYGQAAAYWSGYAPAPCPLFGGSSPGRLLDPGATGAPDQPLRPRFLPNDGPQNPCPPFEPLANPDGPAVRDLVLGLSLLIAGGFLAVLHRRGTQLIESPEERLDSRLARAQEFLALAALGLVSIVALPAALAAVLGYALARASDRSNYLAYLGGHATSPGRLLAFSLLIGATWAVLFWRMYRKVRPRLAAKAPAATPPPTPPPSTSSL